MIQMLQCSIYRKLHLNFATAAVAERLVEKA